MLGRHEVENIISFKSCLDFQPPSLKAFELPGKASFIAFQP